MLQRLPHLPLWSRPFSVSAVLRTLPTIYALSTKPGRAALAVVRISGTQASHVYTQLTGATAAPTPKRASVRELYSDTGVMLDQALTLYFKGPKTFTGEDILELHLHGGNAVVAAVLRAIKELHVAASNRHIRYAENGEFSRRAFQNGRFDLTEVEGIREMIDAETESQRVAALSSIKGEAKTLFFHWREDLVNNVALLTTVIDFGEDHELEEVAELFLTVDENITRLRREVEGYLARLDRSAILLRGIKLTLLGPPNAGKSSLLNTIANRDAAIVSPVAGTTRDVIDIPLDINGYKVVMGDTAGIRRVSEADEIEAEGIKRAKQKSVEGNVVVLVVPVDQAALEPSVVEHISSLTQRVIVVLNKCDLVNSGDVERARKSVESVLPTGVTFVPVSCVSGEGIPSLLETLTAEFKALSLTEDCDPISLSQRSKDILHNDVLFGFDQFARFKADDDVVLATEGLRNAIEGIGKITGQSVGLEEILGVVFSNFCIGK